MNELARKIEAINELLNPTIERAEKALAGLKLQQSASIPFGENRRLGFGKVEQQWKLYIEPPFQLLTTASRKMRLEALALLPVLLDELAGNTESFLAEAELAIARAEDWLRAMERER